jgi:hypothetical protein
VTYLNCTAGNDFALWGVLPTGGRGCVFGQPTLNTLSAVLSSEAEVKLKPGEGGSTITWANLAKLHPKQDFRDGL